MKTTIIGAGLLGLATAFYLQKRGVEVVVVDRQAEVGRETSFANGGMLHASQSNPWNEPGVLWNACKMLGREDSALLVRAKALPRMLGWGMGFVRESRPVRYAANLAKNARLARYSIESLGELRRELALSYDEAAIGTIKMFRSKSDFDEAMQFFHRFDAFEIPYEVCDVPRLMQLEPALRPIESEIAGGVYFPDDESGDAQKFCQGLFRRCQAAGVEFALSREVSGFVTEAGRIRGIETNEGNIDADSFVLAAGSYSAPLAKTAGLRLPIQPVKGYSLTVPVDGWDAGPKIPVIDEQLHAAVCPMGDRLRVAGTAEFAGYNLELTKTRIDNLFSLLNLMYPHTATYLERDNVEQWCGLRPMTTDGVGIMGATPIANLYLNTGHGHLGWTMAAGAGRAVADEITGVGTKIPIEDYALARFS